MTAINTALIKYVIKAAIRDRLVLSFLALVIVTSFLSIFIGGNAVIEARQFTLVFASGGLRLASVAGLVLFTVFFVRRSFDAKDVEYLLSRPISRLSYVLSHGLAFTILATIMALFVFLCLFFSVPDHQMTQGLVLWAFSLWVELVILTNAIFFFAMVLTSAVSSTLAVMALYMIARMMGTLLGVIDTGLPQNAGFGMELFAGIFEFISLIVPRLDLMAQTSWLIYGPQSDIGFLFVLFQGAAYTSLLLVATYVDLRNRQF